MQRKKPFQSIQFSFSWLILTLLLALSLLLGACGTTNDPRGVTTSNAQVSAAIQLPPTEVLTGTSGQPTQPTTAARATTAAETTTSGELTSTPVIAATPTGAGAASGSVTAPTPVPAISAAPLPTTTPTPSANAERVDRAAELKTIKTAYDAIREHLFKEPDTAAILNAALKETASVIGKSAPVVNFGKGADSNWQLFQTAWNKLMESVPEFKYPKTQLSQRVVNVMADTVGDEHTYYLDANSYQSRQNLLSGDNSSVGFGVLVSTEAEKAFVVRIVPNSPADKAGVRPGDQIVKYDEQPIDDKNWTIIRNAKENETHTFLFGRPGEAGPVTLKIVKKKYTLPTVEYRMINGHIGYVAVRDFFLNVADETDRAMTELRKQGADSWLIDLRENPGGVNVEQEVGRFVAGGEVMGYNSDRKNREAMKVSNDLAAGPNKGKPFSPQLPLVVLIDDVSASSSEMFALAVRDFKLGTLIGVKTAGALGHTAAYPLGDGSAISVTVDEYESRGGTKANGIGVTPDVTVERTIQDLVSNRDPQLTSGVEYLEKQLAKK